jgi:hypothetical protein
MAATIAIAKGYDSGRVKETHRLGSQTARAEANTWQTFASVETHRNGASAVKVKRNGATFRVGFGDEDSPLVPEYVRIDVQRPQDIAPTVMALAEAIRRLLSELPTVDVGTVYSEATTRMLTQS